MSLGLGIGNGIRVFGVLCGMVLAEAGAQSVSDLWGKSGERWSPASRLPDFSFAGYRSGERAIPELPVTASVKDFGAKGDGITDDTQAFKDAIEATHTGAVLIPAGRYKITDVIYIRKSGVVLRGAGPANTTLWFPKLLTDIFPGRNFSYSSAFMTLEGGFGSQPITGITAVAKRGDTAITLASTSGLQPGQRIQVQVQEDAAQSLKTYLYNNDPGPIENGKPEDSRMVFTLVKVDGNRLILNRPLRFETRASWRPQVLTFAPTVSESGFERMRIEFPETTYLDHFKEKGANAFEIRGVTDCWVRDVQIHNADLGVIFENACFNTSQGTLITSFAGRAVTSNWTGHHAISLTHSQDNFVTQFDLRTRYVHDLSVQHASGNVFGNGKGVDLNFDHHRDTPYANLYVDIDAGAGTRVFSSGGAEAIGKHSAAWSTFWNIRSDADFKIPPPNWGPDLMNFVAVRTYSGAAKDVTGRWVEKIEPARIQPQDIHAAQLSRRLLLHPLRAIRAPYLRPRAGGAKTPAWRRERSSIVFGLGGKISGGTDGTPAFVNLQGRRLRVLH